MYESKITTIFSGLNIANQLLVNRLLRHFARLMNE